MRRRHRLVKALLWAHLFVCLIWLYLFRTEAQPPVWMIHVFLWSVLGIQFSWGYTVGLIAGPSRRRRWLLWFSLLTVFMPLYFVAALFRLLVHFMGLPTALMYLAIFVTVLSCETFCGVLLGVRANAKGRE